MKRRSFLKGLFGTSTAIATGVVSAKDLLNNIPEKLDKAVDVKPSHVKPEVVEQVKYGKMESAFDTVLYTGDGQASRQISHNLGMAPNQIIIKNRTSPSSWKIEDGKKLADAQMFDASKNNDIGESYVSYLFNKLDNT